jgi:hypothetical protein
MTEINKDIIIIDKDRNKEMLLDDVLFHVDENLSVADLMNNVIIYWKEIAKRALCNEEPSIFFTKQITSNIHNNSIRPSHMSEMDFNSIIIDALKQDQSFIYIPEKDGFISKEMTPHTDIPKLSSVATIPCLMNDVIMFWKTTAKKIILGKNLCNEVPKCFFAKQIKSSYKVPQKATKPSEMSEEDFKNIIIEALKQDQNFIYIPKGEGFTMLPAVATKSKVNIDLNFERRNQVHAEAAMKSTDQLASNLNLKPKSKHNNNLVQPKDSTISR